MTQERRAHEDFERALMKSFWRRIATWFFGGNNELLPFDEVKEKITMRGQHHLGLRQVPINAIVGSVGRYRDFDRAFFPTQTFTKDRWVSIDKAHYADIILPPVELYKIGEIYFVRDGNHRISVARERGQVYVDAYVTEIDVPVPIKQTSDLDSLALDQEYERFLEESKIHQVRPQAEIHSNVAGQYSRLLEHISAHRWYLGEERGGEVSYEESVASWYENVYKPVVDLIREQGLSKEFPESSETDLYLWVMEYQWYLRQAYRQARSDPEESASRQLLEEYPHQPIKHLVRALMRTDAVSDLILRQEKARFLERTRLQEYRQEADVITSIPGAYDELLDHIRVHRWYLGENRKAEVSYQEAVLSWYDNVLMPLVTIIREGRILENFPGRSEIDLYLWIIKRQWYLREAMGSEIPAAEIADQISYENAPPMAKVIMSLRQAAKRMSEELSSTSQDTPNEGQQDTEENQDA